MDKAEQQGAHFVQFFDKYFLIGCPLNIFLNSVGSVIYNKLAFGYIDPLKLFRAFALM